MEPVNVFIDAVNALIEELNALNDAVVTNDPVLITVAEPVSTVKANVVPPPFVNVITLLLTEAVTNAFGVNDDVAAFEADVLFAAYEADVATDE